MDYEQIIHEQRGDVVVLTLDRPEKLNAWTRVMNHELVDAIQAADADSSVGAVVITGSGRGFCAGADIGDAFGSQLDGETPSGSDRPMVNWVELVRSTKPLLAAVNGVAIGVGLTMILPADRIIASDQARFSLRFVKMGLVPELASSRFAPQRVGFGAASDLMLSGRMVDATEAVELGLADELCPHDDLVDTAVAKARTYGANPARQLRWIKQLLTENSTEGDVRTAMKREEDLLKEAYRSPEHREAVQAFLAKREPDFRSAGEA
ncbi:MAG: enoyl-CoA hydratase [Actinomycetia bacterium]|nr:enoyl-CoA hydratase [Actinomycetes bacterium]